MIINKYMAQQQSAEKPDSLSGRTRRSFGARRVTTVDFPQANYQALTMNPLKPKLAKTPEKAMLDEQNQNKQKDERRKTPEDLQLQTLPPKQNLKSRRPWSVSKPRNHVQQMPAKALISTLERSPEAVPQIKSLTISFGRKSTETHSSWHTRVQQTRNIPNPPSTKGSIDPNWQREITGVKNQVNRLENQIRDQRVPLSLMLNSRNISGSKSRTTYASPDNRQLSTTGTLQATIEQGEQMAPNSRFFIDESTKLSHALDETVRRGSLSLVGKMLHTKPLLGYKEEAMYAHYEALSKEMVILRSENSTMKETHAEICHKLQEAQKRQKNLDSSYDQTKRALRVSSQSLNDLKIVHNEKALTLDQVQRAFKTMQEQTQIMKTTQQEMNKTFQVAEKALKSDLKETQKHLCEQTEKTKKAEQIINEMKKREESIQKQLEEKESQISQEIKTLVVQNEQLQEQSGSNNEANKVEQENMVLQKSLAEELQCKSQYVNEIECLKSQLEEMRQRKSATSPVSGFVAEQPKAPPSPILAASIISERFVAEQPKAPPSPILATSIISEPETINVQAAQTVNQDEKKSEITLTNENLDLIEIEYNPTQRLHRDPVLMMLEHSKITYKERKVYDESLNGIIFPTIIVDKQRMGRTTDILKGLGGQLGYFDAEDMTLVQDSEQLVGNFIDLRTYFSKMVKTTEKVIQQKKNRLSEVLKNLCFQQKPRFICKQELTIADFCMAAIYLDIMESQKTDNQALKLLFCQYEELFPYWLMIEKTFGGDYLTENLELLEKQNEEFLMQKTQDADIEIIVSPAQMRPDPLQIVLQFLQVDYNLSEQSTLEIADAGSEVQHAFPAVIWNGKHSSYDTVLREFSKQLGYFNHYDHEEERLQDPLIRAFMKFRFYQVNGMVMTEKQTANKELKRLRNIMKTLFFQLKEHKSKFSCGKSLKLVDFCMASLFIDVQEQPSSEELKQCFAEKKILSTYFQNLVLALQFKGGMSFGSASNNNEIASESGDDMSSLKDTERSETVGTATLGLNDRCSKISFDGSSFIHNKLRTVRFQIHEEDDERESEDESELTSEILRQLGCAVSSKVLFSSEDDDERASELYKLLMVTGTAKVDQTELASLIEEFDPNVPLSQEDIDFTKAVIKPQAVLPKGKFDWNRGLLQVNLGQGTTIKDELTKVFTEESSLSTQSMRVRPMAQLLKRMGKTEQMQERSLRLKNSLNTENMVLANFAAKIAAKFHQP